MQKKIGRIWMWIGAITVALIALITVWMGLPSTERFEINSPEYQAGVAAYEDGDYATAIEKLQPLAEQGHAEAQFTLGLSYEKNGDSDTAYEWILKAAEQNHPEAQFQFGKMHYDEGYGWDVAEKEAVKWVRKAAEQGHADAQSLLGLMYYQGRGVEKNKKEAKKWVRRAAEQGHADAQYALGNMYDLGEGGDGNNEEAEKWFRKAAEQEHPEAQDYVDRIEVIGKKASDFTLQTLTGERFNLAEQRDRPILLNFWATWCPPCRAEMSDLEKLQQTLGDSILIVGIDDEPADTVREFVQDRGFTWTFVLDPDNEAALAYNVSVIPTSVFIDAKGVIVRRFFGQQDYETFLEAAREAIGD